MLILTRREGDILEVTVPETGDVLTMMVTEIKGSQVKLGMTCPRHWNIRRLEMDGIRGAPHQNSYQQ
jgi:sRNA-binding carbon storage regulator CsrA